MSEEVQMVINGGLGFITFLIGVLMKVIWDAIAALKSSLDEMRRDDVQLAAKVQSIELLVAGTYTKRDEFEKLSQAIFAKLDKIMDKLDGKVDRTECERFHDK